MLVCSEHVCRHPINKPHITYPDCFHIEVLRIFKSRYKFLLLINRGHILTDALTSIRDTYGSKLPCASFRKWRSHLEKKWRSATLLIPVVQEAIWVLGSGSEQFKVAYCRFWHFFTRNPGDNSRFKDRLEYYVWLAKTAEKGKITSIFFADTYGFFDTYNKDVAAQSRGGSHTGTIDPVVIVSAMAMVTKSVNFAITGSTTYLSKFYLQYIASPP